MGFFSADPPKQTAATRPFRCVVILGSPGMGKSTLVDELIDAWAKERKGAGVLAILDPARQFRHRNGDAGVVAVWPGEVDADDDRSPDERAESWIRALKKARVGRDDTPPALVVLDDADTYMNAGSPRGIWRDFLMTFRHWRCDVIATGRRTQELPKVLCQNASLVAIFASTEPYFKEYIRAWLGPKVAKAVPDAPHHYILVDVLTKDFKEYKTAKRKHLTAADLS